MGRSSVQLQGESKIVKQTLSKSSKSSCQEEERENIPPMFQDLGYRIPHLKVNRMTVL